MIDHSPATRESDEPRSLCIAGHFPNLPPPPKPLGFTIEYRKPAAFRAEPGKGNGGRGYGGLGRRSKVVYVRADGTLVRR